MRRTLVGSGVGALVALVSAGAVFPQATEGVVVTGSRAVTEEIGRSNIGAPINNISVSYNVSYADLDLKTSAGQKALKERVEKAAVAACKEISRTAPEATPTDFACASKATDAAMVRVKELIATANE